MIKRVKIPRKPIEKIQEGKGKEIARSFFLSHLTPSIATQIIYKKAYNRVKQKNPSYVVPLIHKYLSEWKKEGFMETLKGRVPRNKKKMRNDFYPVIAYRFNLNPFYINCEKEHKIIFSKKEKEFIDLLFNSIDNRAKLIIEYPKFDFIKAIPLLYVKEYIIHLKFKSSLDKNTQKEIDNSIKLSNKIIKIKSNIKGNRVNYLIEKKKHPKFIEDIDKKCLQILKII